MKKKLKSWLLTLIITIPFAFVLIFFGLLPPRYDAVVYTNNIVGEGSCSSYLTDTSKSFAYLYQGDAYFGEELKTLRLFRLPYNVESIRLYMYNIDEADIISFDISVFGRTVTHISKDGVTHPFTATPKTAVVSNEAPLVHLVNDEHEESLSMLFPGSSVIPAYIWFAYGFLILLAAGLLALLLSVVLERLPGIRLPLMSVSAILLTMIIGCFLCGGLPYVNYTYFLLNALLLLAAAMLINSLTLPWIGTVAVSLFTLLWYVADHFVIQFRNKPIMPADLKAFGTAKEVAGGYDLRPSWQMAAGAVVVLLFLAAVILVWKKNRPKEKAPLKKRLILRGVGVVVAAGLLYFGVHNPAFSQLNSFQWDARVLEGFHREGIVLTFAKSAIGAHVSRPEGYSREAVDSYLSDYRNTEQPTGVRPTRIIMIMNEAFSDLRTVGLDERIDVMPFIDSLDENTVEGTLFVSVAGGGTCNTEFEALTGNTMAFLGPGAYPYTENVVEPLFSLASYFSGEQYVTEAFHPSKARNWNRNTVYPNLGFHSFFSHDDLESTEDSYIHAYISDAADYAFIEQRDEENAGRNRFLFNVTIQNHADYDHFQDVPEAETLLPFKDSLHQNARVYLSLLKLSDDAVRQLLEHYRDSDEPTMIIFFGDHEPSLPAAARENVYTDMQMYLDYFKSKFFIWTNYPTETQHDAAISANYLPWLILERGNFPLPPYMQLLKAVHEKYPIITSQGVIDAEGNVYDNVAELMDDPLIRKYQYVQYANLFDEIDPAWFAVD
ncbi:MAG: LTA synthase family protein [Oscillospiraceae bacterium]|nr:LTA synthase family protein [Oscillospiraceae bacterium]